MKKRLRKKLHKGEFRELGFSFDAKFKTDTEMQVVEEWLQDVLVELGVADGVQVALNGENVLLRLEFQGMWWIYHA